MDRIMRIATRERSVPAIIKEELFRCSVCQAASENSLFALPLLPLTGRFRQNNTPPAALAVDQFFFLCPHCGQGQLGSTLDPAFLYGPGYAFRTQTSFSAQTDLDVFLSFLDEVAQMRQFDSVVEVGCNDLAVYQRIQSRVKNFIGIDPILKGRDASLDPSVLLIPQCVEEVDLSSCLQRPPDLLICRHTLEHLVNPRLVLKKMFQIADNDTLLIFEVPDFDSLVKEGRFDRVFNEHIQYFSLSSFRYLLEDLGFHIVKSRINHLHWQTLLIAFRKGDGTLRETPELSQRETDHWPQTVLDRFLQFQRHLRSLGEKLTQESDAKLMGYGASPMLPILFYYLAGPM